MKFKIRIKGLPVAVMLPVIVACTPQKIPQTNNFQAPSLSPEIIAGIEQQSNNSPLSVVIANDLSGSRADHRIASLTLEQLQPLIAYISKHGGEIAFLSICDDSNRAAIRVKIPSPPVITKDDFQLVSVPVPPDRDKINAFDYPQALKEFENEEAKSQAQQAENQKILADKQSKRDLRQKEANQKLGAFKTQLQPELNRDATCQLTDIYSVIDRANLVLNEEQIGWSQSPKKFALFVTDGLDTRELQPVELTKDAELLLVNGSGSSGVFAEGSYKQFESVPSAVRYLVHIAQSKES
ncbi:MAG: hypothetical protein AAFQ80_17695 [Cyanobacteria bacterium J06621_8]